jgi:endonuclease/exonuclease/phosphatase family metal-dependent hydrolase
MPFYQGIDPHTTDGKRTLERLLALRAQLDGEIPPRDLFSNLLLATWNIREFDSPAYGERVPEAMYYIAEIIDRFDLVAVQEVRRDLRALRRLCEILGGYWDYIVSDVTEGTSGNDERMAFLYDSRKVRFGGLAGELVLPPVETVNEAGEKVTTPVEQIVRTPLMCGFKAGWSDFILCIVHIRYGSSQAEDPQRVREIREVAEFLRGRTFDRTAWSRNLIVLGDFNIFKTTDETMKALTDAGFTVPEELQNLPSNAPKSKFYDQIAFRVRRDRFGTTGRAGVFDYYQTVFRDADEAVYAPLMGESYLVTSHGDVRDEASKRRYYRTYWRTFQMSDHLPMWVELKIDYSDDYLQRRLDAGSS